ncbi:HRDC domain-containing protein [Sutcliffiella sp. NC1]|uniref:HRDC domain-containing protein n=1 Tax=Sutcliffiella sp. NC1 TaxID=3004096 RepID=UPI0022DE0679|nr:HRDC domain-containing protein [Sutcliffiella sp. NC1]WBL16855.1 HRDC domain-containing protein [Sutcliffiella sp. NC1]
MLSDKRDIKEPVVLKDFNPKNNMIDALTKMAESNDSKVDQKKVEQHLKLFSIGQTGESSVMFELKNSMLPIVILHDVNIEFDDYKAQMDFVIVTHKFILVLEVKKLFGNITVTDKGEFQRVITKNNRVVNKEGMYSPINQVERHVAILEKLLKARGVITKCPIRYAVTFANPKTIIDVSNKAQAHIQKSIIRHDQIKSFLTAELKKESPVFILDHMVMDIAEAIKDSCKEKEFDASQYLMEDSVAVEPIVENKIAPSFPDKNNVKYVLIDYRSKKAKQQECAPYHVFTNKTLDEILEKLPTTMDELLNIHGIGAQKAELYGQDILAIIQKSRIENKEPVKKEASPDGNDIRTSLIEFRSKRAKELGAKSYYIFTNKTLDALVNMRPKTMEELLSVEGIGPKKAEEFGVEILEIINAR